MKRHFLLFLITLAFGTNLTLCAEQITMTDLPIKDGICIKMAVLEQQGFAIGISEVTQELYEAITGENPSHFIGKKHPVDTISWYDAIVFCNKLSIALNCVPVYSVNGSTNPDDWGYSPHSGTSITAGPVEWNYTSEGFRLPTEEEWIYAAKSGRNGEFAGSGDIEKVGWYSKNSGSKSHEVMTKAPNGYGLYDMCGNAWEWCWDSYTPKSRYKVLKGGSINSTKKLCTVTFKGHIYPSRSTHNYSYFNFGLRLVSSAPVTKQ